MAGESISMTARRAGSGGRAAIARLRATPRFVRSIEERITMPSSSMSRIVSSLQEYQSTMLRRFSAVTASRSTPSPRRSATTASGDWLETTTSPLPPDLRPSARNVSAKRSFSWPGGPWRMTLDPTGRPPWTMASKPSMPVASRVMRSRFQGPGEATTDGEVRIHAQGVPQGRLEDALRGVRSQALGADGPEVSVNLGDELSEIVQAPSRPVDHLLEDGLPQFLVVRRQPMLHLRLDRRRAEVTDSFEEGVEICDVEVNHFAQRRRVVHEIDVEAEVGRSQAILERPRIVFSSFDQAELREALQELRRGRDVDVEGTGDLAREVPIRVAKGPQDGEAVLAGEEHDGSLERLLVHRRLPSSERA